MSPGGGDDTFHGGNHIRMMDLAQHTKGAGQVIGTQDHRVEAGQSDDVVNCIDRFGALDHDGHEHTAIGMVDVVIAHATVVRSHQRAKAPAPYGGIAAVIDDAADLVDGRDLGDDDTWRARVEDGFDEGGGRCGHTYHHGPLSTPCRHQVGTHGLGPHRRVFQVDPEKVDAVGQRFADLGVDETDAAAEQNLARSQTLSEDVDALKDHGVGM